MGAYQPVIRCSNCGDAILFLTDEQEARRAADAEHFEMLCFLCNGTWTTEPDDLDGDG